jgi:hypothetical protein
LSLFYILTILLSLGFGVYHLFIRPIPEIAVHFLLIALYFFVTLFELKGKPFSRSVYLLLIWLLLADGIVNLFIFPTTLLSGMVSLFFALLAWRTLHRMKIG